jgi:hypothetical protein
VSVHSDNEWTAKAFEDTCLDHGISHTCTPPYNSRNNGQIERGFGTLKGLLRACLRGINQHSWDQWLPKIAFAMNITIHAGLQQTPFRMIYGDEARVPLASLVGSPEPQCVDSHEHMLRLSLSLARTHLAALDKFSVYQRRTALTYTQKSPLGTEPTLGLRVWYWSPYRRRTESTGLSAKWTGPWVITAKVSPILVQIRSLWRTAAQRPELLQMAVVDRLLLYVEGPATEADLDVVPDDPDEHATQPRTTAEEVTERTKETSESPG